MTNTTSTPVLTIQSVPTGRAWTWIVQSFDLFKANPAMWLVLFLIYLAIMVPLSLLPVIGPVLTTLLAPIFSAGLMWGCQALVKNQDLEINHLFAGFKHNVTQLIAVGGLYMLSLLVIAIFVVLTLSQNVIDALGQGQELSPDLAMAVLIPILMALFLLVPVWMASWFAPVLVGLHNLTAVEAMQLSFKACLKNMVPLSLYGLIFTLLLIVAMIPYGLGLVVVIPLMMLSVYTSYADIFHSTDAT